MWFLDKLFVLKDQPAPRFAFRGTVNWMRGLAMICDNNGFTDSELISKYNQVIRRKHNEDADILAFECLLMSLHNVNALENFIKTENPYSFVRSAIVTWYYAIYYASKAMIAASSGINTQTHAKTSKIWQMEIVDKKLVQEPFGFSIVDLTSKNVESNISSLRGTNSNDLSTTPLDISMSFGAIYSYLKGTAEHEKERLEEQVKESSEFKQNKYTSFRTKAAQLLRDRKLQDANVNFLVQAFRYRGKANYRDSIYLSYGDDNTSSIIQFENDLYKTALCFVKMTCYYVSRRVNKDNWINYSKDLNVYCKFDLPFDLTKI